MEREEAIRVLLYHVLVYSDPDTLCSTTVAFQKNNGFWVPNIYVVSTCKSCVDASSSSSLLPVVRKGLWRCSVQHVVGSAILILEAKPGDPSQSAAMALASSNLCLGVDTSDPSSCSSSCSSSSSKAESSSMPLSRKTHGCALTRRGQRKLHALRSW